MEEEFEDMMMDMEETSSIKDVKEEDYSDQQQDKLLSL